MKKLVKKGKSTSAIIAEFMKETNLKMDDFKFEVIEEGKKGFLNLFGNKQTKIKFLIPDDEEIIKEYLTGILKRLPMQFKSLKISQNQPLSYSIDIIKPDNPGFLIGKSAKFLDSLEYLLNQMVNKRKKKNFDLIIDVDNYRKRRKKSLIKKVKKVSKKVKKRKKSITIEPMSSRKRKIVHDVLKKDNKIKTMTVGGKHNKRVVILPADKIKKNKKR